MDLYKDLTEKEAKAAKQNSEYWRDRTANSQAKLSNKNAKKINRQLRKYYGSAMKKTIEDFESTYNKLLARQEEGKPITPADLYKLDKYWTMQGQLRNELQKLGDRQISALGKIFEIQFFDIYYSIAIPSKRAFTEIDRAAALGLINAIWCADGMDFKQRVWNNTNNLMAALNDELMHCVITGKKTTELKKLLEKRFGVEYYKADRVARTEISHIQNVAARQRYQDYGIKEFMVWADKDERRCSICGKLHKKRVPIGEPSPVPVHPNCRCSIIPVVE
jgi:SPP1 gp7 family putative phage head morphogenesis protein